MLSVFCQACRNDETNQVQELLPKMSLHEIIIKSNRMAALLYMQHAIMVVWILFDYSWMPVHVVRYIIDGIA